MSPDSEKNAKGHGFCMETDVNMSNLHPNDILVNYD